MNRCIIMKDGAIIGRSDNLAGIRRYCGKNLADHVEIKDVDSRGMLYIVFDNGATFETPFASFQVLKQTLTNWRNLYGVQLKIDGLTAGNVSFDNEYLRR